MTGVEIWTMPDAYEVDEDGSLVVAAAGVLTNDLDVTGDPLTAINFTDPAHGILTANSDGSFTYQPDADFAGNDSFTYQATDGGAISQEVTVSLTITPVNDAPTATADSYEANENIQLLVNRRRRCVWITIMTLTALTWKLCSRPMSAMAHSH